KIKNPGVLKRIEQFFCFLTTIQIIDYRGYMLDLRFNGIPEHECLKDRHHKHEEQCGRLSANMRKLFDQNRPQPVGAAFGLHNRAGRSLLSVLSSCFLALSDRISSGLLGRSACGSLAIWL